MLYLGSGCGTVDQVIASNTTESGFRIRSLATLIVEHSGTWLL